MNYVPLLVFVVILLYAGCIGRARTSNGDLKPGQPQQQRTDKVAPMSNAGSPALSMPNINVQMPFASGPR